MTARPILAATACCALAAPALADVTAMCLEQPGATEELCACVTEALLAETGEEDAALYEAVGTRYLANKAAGQGMADAWDAAIAETAAEAGLDRIALLTRMNDVGRAHQAAMTACAGG